jgi:hypothetical protein
VAAVLYHRELKTICQKTELKWFFIGKIIIYIGFIAEMSIAYFIQTANSKLITLILFISVGFMTILYTYGIFNLRMLATKLPDANNN